MGQEVMIYTLSTCSHCKAAKRFLDENDVDYNSSDIDLLQGEDRSAIIEEVKKINPNLSFPTMVIGDKIVVGFKENEMREALKI